MYLQKNILQNSKYYPMRLFVTLISCYVYVLSNLQCYAANVTANGNYTGLPITFSVKQTTLSNGSDSVLIENVRELLRATNVELNISDIPLKVHFVVIQVHSFLYNVTLGYNSVKKKHDSVNGSNVGLVQIVAPSGTAKVYLQNDNLFTVTVLITVIAYDKTAPIPGGCNMEFSLETAPYLQLRYDMAMVTVDSQPAKIPEGWMFGDGCSISLLTIRYEMYHMFMPEQDLSIETYFNSLKAMMTVTRIRQNGRLVRASPLYSPMRRVYSAYRGVGSVYATLAILRGRAAAYVPTHTYACSATHFGDSCLVLQTNYSRLLCSVLFFLGLFVCLFGHLFFKLEMFVMGALSGGFVAYVVFTLQDTGSGALQQATGMSPLCGLLWLSVWILGGSPVVSTLLPIFNTGFLITAVLFNIGLGDLPPLESDLNNWLAFVCVMLSVLVVMSPLPMHANMASCAFIGAYVAVIPLDLLIGGTLKYILLNVVRRLTVEGFNGAVLDPPFQTRDAILFCLLIMLAVVGYMVQWHNQGGKPPFPPPRLRLPPLLHRRNLPSPTVSTPLLADGSRRLTYSTPGSDNVFQ